MSEQILTALIGVAPQVLLVAIVGGMALALRRPLTEKILPRVSAVKVVGLELSLQPEQVQDALQSAAAVRARPSPPAGAAEGLLVRAERNVEALRDRQVLWVDDHPERTTTERHLLHSIGLFVETARSNAEAADSLARHVAGRSWDVLVSDIRRDSGTESGLDLVAYPERPPLIYYVGKLDRGVPDGAFGITNRPDELLHLILDVLERSDSGSAGWQEGRS